MDIGIISMIKIVIYFFDGENIWDRSVYVRDIHLSKKEMKKC